MMMLARGAGRCRQLFKLLVSSEGSYDSGQQSAARLSGEQLTEAVKNLRSMLQ
jgi:hypothetical protein